MTWLVRKVQLSKWNSAEWSDDSRVPADAVTVDLRTYSNTLSFWLIEGDGQEYLQQAAVAIAAGLDRIDTFDVLAIPLEAFSEYVVEATPGRTAARDLRTTHRDLVSIDQDVLVDVSLRLAPLIHAGRARRFTRTAIIGLLKPYLDAGKLDRDQLSEHVLGDLTA